jgi:hypothetical protein
MYVIKGNTDQTEGRGATVDRKYYYDLEEAARIITSGQGKKWWGVMGVGDVDLYVRVFKADGHGGYDVSEQKLYGYRKDWQGKWNYGWLDNRDAPVNDPDYAEWLRLNKKFGVQA